jgi:hypothetical protein
MRRHHRHFPKASPPISGAVAGVRVLPSLATAEQIAEVLQVSSRTVHLWAAAETIPTALRCGKVVRFNPPAVATALGINLPEFGVSSGEVISPDQPQNQCPETKHRHE